MKKFTRFIPYVAVALVAFGVGMFTHAKLYPQKITYNPAASLSAQTAEHSLTKKSNLDQALKSTNERIDLGVKRNEITKAQADKLKTKAKEIYDFRKTLPKNQKDADTALNKKRTEWRKWLQDNQLTLKYILPLYWG